jgi:raffinose/stachyose/melibiose transport system permease protein
MTFSGRSRAVLRTYPNWFYLPAALVFGVFFVVPTVLAFYFSLTRWTLFSATFIGLENYITFLNDPMLMTGLRNTLIYAVLTSGLKIIISLPLAMLLTSSIRFKGLLRSIIFFPVLVSTVAVGITFSTLMQPSVGLINTVLGFFGLPQPDWLGDPGLALYSVAMVDVWKGVGIATVIFMAGILTIPQDYFEAARLEGARPKLCRPCMSAASPAPSPPPTPMVPSTPARLPHSAAQPKCQHHYGSRLSPGR